MVGLAAYEIPRECPLLIASAVFEALIQWKPGKEDLASFDSSMALPATYGKPSMMQLFKIPGKSMSSPPTVSVPIVGLPEAGRG